MDPFAKRRWIAGCGFVLFATLAAVWIARSTRRPSPPPSSPPKPVPPAEPSLPTISQSPFLNTRGGATYVGSSACVGCHKDEHKSYLKTAHSRALARLDPATEPPGMRFFHAKSGRQYEVAIKDGVMRHRESLVDGEREVVLNDQPVKYVIGSGHHSRSYLLEVDGFLVESPLTWYAEKKSWGMSPGYDVAAHQGFTRATGIGCIACHAGRVEAIDRSINRLRIHEQVIGCENCHGPGSLHVQRRSEENLLKEIPVSAQGIDRTIVNPAHLSRNLREAVCSHCHLRGAATVFVRGRGVTDFRPGLPLADFQVDYRFANDDGSMKVTGHVEQMRQSRCYTASQTMTCTTCHNPHSRPEPAERIEHYRSKCQSCHPPDKADCKLPEKRRLAKNPQNNCVACHMPQSTTDIPHFAFTHHRVGLNHKTEFQKTELTGRERIVPVNDISKLSELERLRCLGLAYLELGDLNPGRGAEGFYQQAYSILYRVRNEGIRDGELLSALARIGWERKFSETLSLAKQAVAADNGLAKARANVLYVLGDIQLGQGDAAAAEKTFERLVKLRRKESDWLMLALCRQKNGDKPGAIRALLTAAAITPDDSGIQRALADAYRAAGDQKAALKHEALADRLDRLRPKSRTENTTPRNEPQRE